MRIDLHVLLSRLSFFSLSYLGLPPPFKKVFKTHLERINGRLETAQQSKGFILNKNKNNKNKNKEFNKIKS